jgi:adenylosuccinate lyase
MTNFNTYLSPFTWRYASSEMRAIWSEENKRRLWRLIWVTLAEIQSEYGLVHPEQVAELRLEQEHVNVPRALEIEAEIHHDLMAELKTFAEQCPRGGAVLHMGATSADIEENADVLRIRQSFDLILGKLHNLLLIFADKIIQWADVPVIGFTHLQPAEPTTLGYRLALYAQDLLFDQQEIKRVRQELRGKGFKGSVGTSAAYVELVGLKQLEEFESRLSAKLGLDFYPVTTQVYPRKQDYQVINALAGVGATFYKFALDLRFLQSPPIGELSEPFGRNQVGSSAMPFKRNPVKSEAIDSLARMLAQMPRLAWDNAAHSILERTLDDSANRRTLLPEAFLIVDELVSGMVKIVEGLQIDELAMKRNLETYSPFAGIERVLMTLTKAGADRQAMHERLRQYSMQAWEALRMGQANPIVAYISSDTVFLTYLPADRLQSILTTGSYVGDAPRRARQLANKIRSQESGEGL